MKKLFFVILALSIALTGCLLDNLKKKESTTTTTNPENDIHAPTLTLALPVTLSAVVATQKPRAAASSVPNCSSHFDSNSNFMENGYQLTKFLVGLSQFQSCAADFIMSSALLGAKVFAGKGVITLPSTGGDNPTHLKVEIVDATYKIWIYFATAGQALPSNTSAIKQIYITWTTSGTDTSGKFYMVNLPVSATDPNSPAGLRVDFSRTANTAANHIFVQMRSDHSVGISGFRVDVTRNEGASGATFEVKGRMEFGGASKMFSSLPTTETFAMPVFLASGVLDNLGNGAAIAFYQDFAMHLANDGSNGQAPYNFGSYQYNITDKAYFDTSGNVTWRNKAIPAATYVNTSGANTRSGTSLAAMVLCLELGCPASNIPDMGLGLGYFTSPCNSTNGANCQKFINGLYQNGVFGVTKSDALANEPSDSRQTAINAMTYLTTIHPDQEDGSVTFNVP